MKAIVDLLPVILFFVANHMYNIYVATIAAIVASVILIVYYYIKDRKVEKIHLFSSNHSSAFTVTAV